MFGINKLKRKVNRQESDIKSLEKRLWILENPPKYNKGGKYTHGLCSDVQVINNKSHLGHIYYSWKYCFYKGGSVLTLDDYGKS